MKKLSFETGVVDYVINGKTNISFNPSDIVIMEKLCDAADSLSSYQDSIDNLDMNDRKGIFDFMRRVDADMRKQIDGVFGDGVSASLFGDMNVFSLVKGLPAWARFFESIFQEISESQNEKAQEEGIDIGRSGEASNKVREYLKRYKSGQYQQKAITDGESK